MIRVLYFASLRDAAGTDGESLDAAGRTAAELYEAVRARHGLRWPRERLRVAVDGAFAAWDTRIEDGAEVAFLPPVSGG